MTTPGGGNERAEGPAQRYFTDRESFLATFRGMLALSEGSTLPVIAFHGVGGVGKTMLLDRLGRELEGLQPPMPYARFNIDNLKSPVSAAREVLTRLRTDLEFGFKLGFPRFDDLLAVLLAGEGGEPPPLVRSNPTLMGAFNLVMALQPIPVNEILDFLKGMAGESRTAERWLAKAGGGEEILHLRERARRDDPTLADELIDRFADDLASALAEREQRGQEPILRV